MTGALSGTTKNFGFGLINFDFPRWSTYDWNNWKILDAALALTTASIKGGWSNSIPYLTGDRVVDTDLGTMWVCLVSHTSPSTDNFAAARTANPTYWKAFGGTPNYRGAWASGLSYQNGDIVNVGYAYYLCVASHTSDNTTNTTSNTSDWTLVWDATAAVNAAATFNPNNFYTKSQADAAFIDPTELASNLSNYYDKISADARFIDTTEITGYVQTSRKVAGHPLTADVTLAKADVGLDQVDNTSDMNKPVSTAQQTALNAKLSLSGGTMTGQITLGTGGVLVGRSTGFAGGYVQSSALSGFAGSFDTADGSGGGAGLGINRSASAGWAMGFYQGGSSVGNISISGSGTVYNSISDVRVKTDFQPIDAETFFSQVQVYDFAWLDHVTGQPTGERGLGVVAQELYNVEPRAVTVGGTYTWTEETTVPVIDPVTNEQKVDEEGNALYETQTTERTEERMWSVDYSKLVPILIAEIQSLRNRVAALEAKVT